MKKYLTATLLAAATLISTSGCATHHYYRQPVRHCTTIHTRHVSHTTCR